MPLNLKFWKRREATDGESVVGLRHVFEKENGIELHYLNGLVRVEAFRPDLLRVRVTRDLNWPEPISNAVIAKPGAACNFERTVDHLVFSYPAQCWHVLVSGYQAPGHKPAKSKESWR